MSNNTTFHKLSIHDGVNRCLGGQSEERQAVFALPPWQQSVPKHSAGQTFLSGTLEMIATATLVIFLWSLWPPKHRYECR